MTKKQVKKSVPRLIMEARHQSYANLPSGVYEETDLLLMSQMSNKELKDIFKSKSKSKARAND